MSNCCCNSLNVPILTNASLTEGKDGKGTLDVVLSTFLEQFYEFYLDDRLTGGDIATMYPALLDSALSNSVQYLLGRDNATLQAKLIEKQIELADKELALKEKEILLKEAEIAARELETEAQRKKMAAETKLILANIRLTCQKVETEIGQTSNTDSKGNKITGLTGSQIAVYDQQIVNYKRDTEQKLVKMLLDTWITRKGVDDGVEVPTSIDNRNINQVVEKYGSNIDYTIL